MVTDVEKKEVDFNDAYILVTDQTISNLKDILVPLQAASENSKPLLIIADDVEGEALGGLILNLMRGTVKVAAIKAPGFGDEKKELLKDIAALTGAKAIIKEEGIKLSEIDETYLGEAKKIKITKDKTTIVEAKGAELEDRIKLIKAQINSSENKHEKEQLMKRLASLTGGVAILKIGASTETEMKEKKHRVDDALNATRAAVEEGIIVGGGVSLLRAAYELKEEDYEGDEKLGIKIIKQALEYPFKLILENGGLDSSVIKYKVLENKEFSFGYNAKTDKYEDLIKAGVIDPLKVTRLGIQNASSISSLILTTQSLIVDEEKNEDTSQIPDINGMMKKIN
jgi:chaperonin GroEL